MNNHIKYEQLVSEVLGNISNPRTKDILSLRFGLKDGQRKTLEAIGRKHGITRERVRQVEEAAFSELKKAAVIKCLQPAFNSIDRFLNQEGQLVREERLLSTLTNTDSFHPSQGALFFILTLGSSYQRFVESDNFHSYWTNSKNTLDRAQKAITALVKKLEKNQEPVSFDYVLSSSRGFGVNISKKALLSYLDATKQISQNTFDQFGLIKWPEINPRGAKDKAYIIFKKQSHPLHFREVTELINQANLGTNLAQAQTVHNELIKDDRFILVGRGTYALKDWGYQPGTIKDVIVQTLSENGSLNKDQILDKVLKSRLVKKNTVLINLQNRQYFSKEKDGKYSLVNKK